MILPKVTVQVISFSFKIKFVCLFVLFRFYGTIILDIYNCYIAYIAYISFFDKNSFLGFLGESTHSIACTFIVVSIKYLRFLISDQIQSLIAIFDRVKTWFWFCFVLFYKLYVKSVVGLFTSVTIC